MVRKRRRSRYTWMPTLGGAFTNGDETYLTNFFASEQLAGPAADGPDSLYVTPIVPDYTQFITGNQPFENEPSLRDATEGQDWVLKRIVGNLHLALGQIIPTLGNTPKCVYVGAAFFVARASTANQDLPDLSSEEIDPLGTKNVRQPWIWRRTNWLFNGLAADLSNTSPIGEVNNFGQNVRNGPYIDSKVARRIRREERLWFVLNAYGFDDFTGRAQPSYDNPGNVQFSLDYRVLGNMRRSNNRSTF